MTTEDVIQAFEHAGWIWESAGPGLEPCLTNRSNAEHRKTSSLALGTRCSREVLMGFVQRKMLIREMADELLVSEHTIWRFLNMYGIGGSSVEERLKKFYG
jgi:hypothetical protein